MKTVTYILTYNAAQQFRAMLRTIALLEPKFLLNCFVIDQSNDPVVQNMNANLCLDWKLKHVAAPNSGASGGRFQCAEHFAHTAYDAMFFFEDDMMLLHSEANRCRFGFPNNVQHLHDLSIEILISESLDYLKLSFHEVYNDHSFNFPLQRVAAFTKLGSKRNIGYLIGDVYYSNWPMLITKGANELLFHPPRVSEGAVMTRAAQLIATGEIKAGVLAAWPIHHDRMESIDKIDLA